MATLVLDDLPPEFLYRQLYSLALDCPLPVAEPLEFPLRLLGPQSLPTPLPRQTTDGYPMPAYQDRLA